MPVTIDTSGNNGFPVVQVGDILYGVNFWGVDLSVNPNSSGSWTVPCGAQISGNCYELPVEGSAEDTNNCEMCYTIQTPVMFNQNGVPTPAGPANDTSRVNAYPYMQVGSAGGRDNTWGVACGQTGVLAAQGRCGGSAVYDMRDPNAAVGLPERVSNIGNIEMCFGIDKNCSGDPANVENVFIDTYLHRIDKPDLWPTGYQNIWGDLNKINENATETWNINFKYCLPEFAVNATGTGITNDPGAQATGGVRINTTPIVIDGKDWAVYFKWEQLGQNNPRNPVTGLQQNGKCTNSFFYISFIPWNVATTLGQQNQSCPDLDCCAYSAFLSFVGSQEFKDRVLGQNGFAPVAANKQGSGQQANWPLWVYQNVGSPPFVVDNPSIYVLDGLQIGNELWFSPNGQQSCVCWSNVQFTTDAGVFGKSREGIVIDPKMVCNSTTCIADVTDGGPCTHNPRFDNGCPSTFQAGIPQTLSITGCCEGSDVQWLAFKYDPVNDEFISTTDIVFSSPNDTITEATSNVTGSYRIEVTCCPEGV